MFVDNYWVEQEKGDKEEMFMKFDNYQLIISS